MEVGPACTRPLWTLGRVLCEVPEHPRAQEARSGEFMSKAAIIQKPAHQGRKSAMEALSGSP